MPDFPDDMPFFDGPAGGPPERGGSGIAARAMAARRGSAPDYLSGLNP